jgi:hypothetical protein
MVLSRIVGRGMVKNRFTGIRGKKAFRGMM